MFRFQSLDINLQISSSGFQGSDFRFEAWGTEGRWLGEPTDLEICKLISKL
jgi:hypothetical protein